MSEIIFKAVDIAELEKAPAVKDPVSASAEAENILAKANAEAQHILAEAKKEAAAAVKKEAKKGYDAGFREGAAEALMLAERLRGILARFTEKRDELLAGAEDSLAQLALDIARKVVKRSCEEYRDTVTENIRYALSAVKDDTPVTIRVSPEDLEISEAHLEEFAEMCGKGGHIRFVFDNSVEKGGCIAETDTCRIDATVSSQLKKVERTWKNVREIQ